MDFKTSSWHYRLLRKCNTYPSNSLCVYFWQVAFRVIGFSIIAALLASLAVCVVAAVIWYGYGLFTFTFVIPGEEIWYEIMARVGAIIILTVATVTLFFLGLVGYMSIKKKTSDSLVGSYIKAKKDKICPVINFVDDEKE